MVVIFIFFGLYYLLVIFLIIGWRRTVRRRPQSSEKNHFISVIVPVRSEAERVNNLLESLNNLNYPREIFEIIIVNDHSEDATETIVSDFIRASGISNAILVQSSGHGKKAALTEGVKKASGEIIVTTDADCMVDVDWLKSINEKFSADTNLLVGAVKIEAGESLVDRMQAIEFSSLIGSGVATLAFGVSTMCNGANLAFRRTAFLEVNGYAGNDHIASGDDEFLLRKIAAKFPGSVQFNNHPESVVVTLPQPTLSAFFRQRLRWAGKWKFHKDFLSRMLAVYVFLFHTLVLLSPVIVLSGYFPVTTFSGLVLIKAGTEFIFLWQIAVWLRLRWSWAAFLCLQVTYPMYAVVVGVLSNFVHPVWKGRKLKISD